MSESFEVLENGVRFKCQGSGKCCVARGEYGYVYLTLDDRKRMAKFLKMKTGQFTKKYCVKDENGMFYISTENEKSACSFLEDKKCSVYEARPTQCRTWPFWPEVMNAKSWSKEVSSYCPGVGKGRYYGPDEIKETMEWQKRSEDRL